MTEEQRKTCDEIIEVARRMENIVAITIGSYPSTRVIIELNQDHVCPEQWDAIEKFNTGLSPLTVGFVLVNGNTN